MDLEKIWSLFLSRLSENSSIDSAFFKKSAGIPFIYISVTNQNFDVKEAEGVIKEASASVMKGKQLHSETVFVRKTQKMYVYHHRFYVPQRKMFCCGNLCPNCIRFNR